MNCNFFVCISCGNSSEKKKKKVVVIQARNKLEGKPRAFLYILSWMYIFFFGGKLDIYIFLILKFWFMFQNWFYILKWFTLVLLLLNITSLDGLKCWYMYIKKKFDMQTEFVSYKLHVIKVASLSWILFDASAFFIF